MDSRTTNVLIKIFGLAVIAALAVIIMGKNRTKPAEGYIGRQEISITDGRMTPEALLAMGRVSDPQYSPEHNLILYGVSYTSVKDNRSCRNLFVIRPDGSGAQQLTFEGSSVTNARWTGEGIAFIQKGQIYVCRVKTGKDGSVRLYGRERISDIPAGIGEFSISPDGKSIMYTSSVKGGAKSPSDIYPDLEKADAICTDDLMYRHWDHWVKEVPHTFVAEMGQGVITRENSTDILAGEKETYELPAEPFSGIEQLCWSPDSRFIAYSCRKLTGKRYAFSTDTEIYIYEVSSGKCSVIGMKGGYDTNPVWSPDGNHLCWISMERDGYEADRQRLMVVEMPDDGSAPDTGNVRELSAGFRYNVSAPVWDRSSDGIFFSALAEGIQGIFHVSLADGSVRRITGEDQWYDFGSPFASIQDKSGETLLTTVCSMNFPTELAAVNADGNWSRITDENGHILSQISEPVTEARHIKTVDGKDMLTWVLYPPQFDSTRVYPSILICLGGPQGTLSQGWSYRWNYRLMADQGYVVVLPNRRGTTAFGQEWTEQISGDYCGLNIQDYLSAARELKGEKYIGRMAACGASYGGYSVYYLCGVHEDTFDAFIAHAGIFNEEHMYMTTEEMWFANWDNGGLHTTEIDPAVGTSGAPIGPKGDGETFGGIRQGGSPWSNAPKAVRHYANSPHKLVTKWHTPLLVIHGGMDFRVPVDEGMAAYNAAQMMGVPSKLLIFPDENHWILKPQNALFWHRQYFEWLERWLKTE